MRATPRISPQHREDLSVRRGLDNEHYSALIGEGTAEHDDTGIDETVHERGMLHPARLVFQRLRRIPVRAVPSLHDDEGRHPVVLQRCRQDQLRSVASQGAEYRARNARHGTSEFAGLQRSRTSAADPVVDGPMAMASRERLAELRRSER